MSLPVFFGISAGVLNFVSFIPYINSIIKGKTRPERASFAIWTGVGGLILVSYFASGARDTIWFVLSYSIMQFVVFVLSFKYGMGGFNKLDAICIFGAVLGLGLWIITRSPLTALYINMAVEAVGFIPTIKKAYYLPETENTLSWTISTVGALLNIFAIGAWVLHIALYPIVIFSLQGVVVALLLLPKRKHAYSKAELYKKF